MATPIVVAAPCRGAAPAIVVRILLAKNVIAQPF